MAEKDYNTWLAEAKAALDGYSAEQAAIAKLYEQAKQNASDAFETQKQQLQSQNKADKNQAATDAMRTERNINQTLASRGLAFSGENAQTHLDVTLGLQNKLADIDRDTRAQTQSLETQKNDTLSSLDLAHANARADSAQKRAELQNELASIAAQQASTQTKTEDKTDTSDGSDTQTAVKPLPNLKGKTLAERVRLMLQYIASQKQNDSADTAYVPEISARELAKQLIVSAGSGGTVTTPEQQVLLTTLLQALGDKETFDEDYYNELMLNLRSMGYRPDYTVDPEQQKEELIEQSQSVYSDNYQRYYAMYTAIGMKPEACDVSAGEQAMFVQLGYLYERCATKKEFESLAATLHMSEDLAEFYNKLSASGKKYVLGAQLQ